jgi:hypothetical protein
MLQTIDDKGNKLIHCVNHACKSNGGSYQKPTRKLNDKEKAKGRSSGYWDMSPEDQWAEDKMLGILDWDGN